VDSERLLKKESAGDAGKAITIFLFPDNRLQCQFVNIKMFQFNIAIKRAFAIPLQNGSMASALFGMGRYYGY